MKNQKAAGKMTSILVVEMKSFDGNVLDSLHDRMLEVVQKPVHLNTVACRNSKSTARLSSRATHKSTSNLPCVCESAYTKTMQSMRD